MVKRLTVLVGVFFSVVASVCGQQSDLLVSGSAPILFPAAGLRVRAVASHSTVTAGQDFHVAVEILIGDGWVYYSPSPGEIVKPAKVAVEARGLLVGEVLWSPDQSYQTDLGSERIVNYVYKTRAVIYLPMTVPAVAQPGRREISATVSGQLCGQVCIDVSAIGATSIEVGPVAIVNSE
ncbi:MAG: hypothetical protein HQ546_06650, partial [Planctomycetes bacterium]|nr:hypothetical protein [Planctomycetota bacterium]